MVNVVGLFIDHCIISVKISVFMKLMFCLFCHVIENIAFLSSVPKIHIYFIFIFQGLDHIVTIGQHKI